MEEHRNSIGPPLPHVLEEELGEEIILFDSERHHFVQLNATAADVWRLSSGEFTLDDIIERLAGAYQTEPAVISHAVTVAVAEFVSAGLIPAFDV